MLNDSLNLNKVITVTQTYAFAYVINLAFM